MKTVYYQKLLKRGKTCPCGEKAVRFSCGVWSCAPCLEKDRAIWATEKSRGTCGFAGGLEPYRLAL